MATETKLDASATELPKLSATDFQTYNHMSAGWSWAFDTPFSWFKQNASRFGGTNQAMAIMWPARIKDKGGLREQFMHDIDIVPSGNNSSATANASWAECSVWPRTRMLNCPSTNANKGYRG